MCVNAEEAKKIIQQWNENASKIGHSAYSSQTEAEYFGRMLVIAASIMDDDLRKKDDVDIRCRYEITREFENAIRDNLAMPNSGVGGVQKVLTQDFY